MQANTTQLLPSTASTAASLLVTLLLKGGDHP
jgi:hypothetical protein